MGTAHRSMSVAVVCGLLACDALLARQRAVYERVPDQVDAKARYIIYLHGRIIEEQGRRPKHPTWGVYEYEQILDAIAADGAVVISEQRAPETDIDQFANHVADQVHELLRRGVPPEQISVVGFSKGGGIAIRSSALLQNPRVNFVFLAACGEGDFSNVD